MIYVLYENEEWLPPLTQALKQQKLPFTALFTKRNLINVAELPPEGVYINRMSPSSHTRGHQDGISFAKEFLWLLEMNDLPVINGSSSFALELSKVRQHAALQAFGIQTPKTVAVVGTEELIETAKKFNPPFITKHNQGGKGLGVQLFHSHKAFEEMIKTDGFSSSPDNINLIQEYIEPKDPFITSVEIVDGTFQYALQSSTLGGFELCPADTCSIDDTFCPVGTQAETNRFRLRTDIDKHHHLVQKYIGFCAKHSIDVAGIEFIEDKEGRTYTYDINCTTNYSSIVEEECGKSGMISIAKLAKEKLLTVKGYIQ
jgi:hypothetical protein